MPSAININAFQACDLTDLPPDTVMVSINEQYAPLHPLKISRQDERVLTLQFSDVTGEIENKGNTLLPIGDEDALALVQFAAKHKDKNFLVHCAAGISRSSAVCLYLNRTYGHTLRPDFWRISHPNYYVVGYLTILSQKYPEFV